MTLPEQELKQIQMPVACNLAAICPMAGCAKSPYSTGYTRGRYEPLGPLKDDDSGQADWRIHDVCITPDGVLYAGENDNPRRSGYLWQVRL